MTRRTALIVLAAATMLVAGCTSTPTPQPSSSTTTGKTFTPEEVAQAEATKAYAEAYTRVNQMGAQPRAKLADYPKTWAIATYVTDPYLTRIVASYAQLKVNGVGIRDPKVVMTPKVLKVDLAAAKPTVTMSYCPTYKPQLFSLKTGENVPSEKPSGAADLPWLVTSTMTKIGNLWKLTDDSLDSKQTCQPG